ncbi:MAG: CATRA system-associated protein [Pseudonocardia sp.]
MRGDLRQHAADVLRTARTWELPEQRWAIVNRVVDELEAALAADDEDAVAEAILDLEQAGPVRGGQQMTTTRGAAGEFRERTSQLVRRLEDPSAADRPAETPPPRAQS